jgi:hypothetical protein
MKNKTWKYTRKEIADSLINYKAGIGTMSVNIIFELLVKDLLAKQDKPVEYKCAFCKFKTKDYDEFSIHNCIEHEPPEPTQTTKHLDNGCIICGDGSDGTMCFKCRTNIMEYIGKFKPKSKHLDKLVVPEKIEIPINGVIEYPMTALEIATRFFRNDNKINEIIDYLISLKERR